MAVVVLLTQFRFYSLFREDCGRYRVAHVHWCTVADFFIAVAISIALIILYLVKVCDVFALDGGRLSLLDITQTSQIIHMLGMRWCLPSSKEWVFGAQDNAVLFVVASHIHSSIPREYSTTPAHSARDTSCLHPARETSFLPAGNARSSSKAHSLAAGTP